MTEAKLTAAMLAKAIRTLEANGATPLHIDITRKQYENLLADIGLELDTLNTFMGVELRIKEKA